jgi:pyruvate dehydrogenase E2 component (dihydrolipoamide acetyltransferase)
MVPHVKDADGLSLVELAAELNDLVKRARDGSASPSDLVGGTFTITNVGVFGVDGGTPMIVPGQAAILAFGAWRERPWVDRGQLVVRTVCTLSLSFDHRFIDGATGSRFLRTVADVLEEPALPAL